MAVRQGSASRMRDLLSPSLSGRKTLLAAFIVAGFFLALLAPNLLWLGNSTLKISNGSAWEVTQIEVEVTGGRESIETLQAGAKAMILLPVTGESDLKLRYRIARGSGPPEEGGCDAGYLEPGGYHVIAEIKADGTADCRVEIASLKRLLVFEVF